MPKWGKIIFEHAHGVSVLKSANFIVTAETCFVMLCGQLFVQSWDFCYTQSVQERGKCVEWLGACLCCDRSRRRQRYSQLMLIFYYCLKRVNANKWSVSCKPSDYGRVIKNIADDNRFTACAASTVGACPNDSEWKSGFLTEEWSRLSWNDHAKARNWRRELCYHQQSDAPQDTAWVKDMWMVIQNTEEEKHNSVFIINRRDALCCCGDKFDGGLAC